MPSVDRVRPGRCPCCGVASRPVGEGLRLHGHGIRLRQMLGPAEALGAPVMLEVACRRYLCVACKAVVLVVPSTMLAGRRYSASAIAQALALFGLEGQSPAKIRGRTSPDKIVGATASTGWASIDRWCDAVRSGNLFPEARACRRRLGCVRGAIPPTKASTVPMPPRSAHHC